MKIFCDLIRLAIEYAPSPDTRDQLVAMLEAATGTAQAADTTSDSGGGGHTDPDG